MTERRTTKKALTSNNWRILLRNYLMLADFVITFKTGYDLTDNEVARVRERIWEALHPIAEEFLADIMVAPSHVLPGPVDLPTRSYRLDDGR
jgi:hypothetical protein